ncbi:flavodoxin family protein [Breznakiellaceae bacterium SP9]
MKTIAINGSPRKGWNTHILVEEARKGAASKGSETELVNLYDLHFKGCNQFLRLVCVAPVGCAKFGYDKHLAAAVGDSVNAYPALNRHVLLRSLDIEVVKLLSHRTQ